MRDDIIRMAREAGIDEFGSLDERLIFFAALVAAQERKNYEHTLALRQRSYEREIEIEVLAERDACAKVALAVDDQGSVNQRWMQKRIAAAIRARRQA